MASTTETGFGVRITNAQNIATHLSAFTGYIALRPTEEIPALLTLISDIHLQNTAVATHLENYYISTTQRRNALTTHPDSLDKILSPIARSVLALYGKTAKESTTIASIIKKLRGVSIAKDSKNPTAHTVSQSHRSIGARIQYLSDLIDTLAVLQPSYTSANINAQLPTLKTRLIDLSAINQAVVGHFNQLTQARDARNKNYNDLKDRMQRIKFSIQSQYGIKSLEYKLIKGLSV